jgi:hypothetical protein
VREIGPLAGDDRGQFVDQLLRDSFRVANHSCHTNHYAEAKWIGKPASPVELPADLTAWAHADGEVKALWAELDALAAQ